MKDTLRLFAFGDSLLWGQGLEDHEKFYRLATERLAAELERLPEARLFAHSGATLGADGEGCSSCSTETPGWEEVPVASPSVVKQIESASDSTQPDVVLLNGGLNDVDYKKVINPFGNDLYQTLDPIIGERCYRDMLHVIRLARRRFPQAILALTPYPPLLSSHADASVIGLLGAVGFQMIGASPVGAAVSFVATEAAKRVAVWRTWFFYQRQLHWLRRAVSEAQADLQLRGPGVAFVHPGFGWDNCIGGSDPLLFSTGTGAGLTSWIAIARGARFSDADRMPVEDPVAERRAAACEACDLKGLDLLICKLASVGHPNQKGNRLYAERVAATLAPYLSDTQHDEISPSHDEVSPGLLRRYGLPFEGLHRLDMRQHQFVDEVSLDIETASGRGAGTDGKVYVRFSGESGPTWRLGGSLQNGDVKDDFEAGSIQRFTIDPNDRRNGERFRLEQIKELTIQKQGRDSWQPRQLTLWINGARVYHTAVEQSLSPGDDTWTAPDWPT